MDRKCGYVDTNSKFHELKIDCEIANLKEELEKLTQNKVSFKNYIGNRLSNEAIRKGIPMYVDLVRDLKPDGDTRIAIEDLFLIYIRRTSKAIETYNRDLDKRLIKVEELKKKINNKEVLKKILKPYYKILKLTTWKK